MATYGKKAQSAVKKVMKKMKRGTLKSGRSGKKVTSRKQAIAIGLSEAREAGAKVPAQKSSKKMVKKGSPSKTKKAAKKKSAKKHAAKKTTKNAKTKRVSKKASKD